MTALEFLLGQAQQPPEANTEPDAPLDATPSEAAEPAPSDDQLGESYRTHLVGDQQPETAPNEQPEASQLPQIDPVEQLLAGDDAELEAQLAEAQQQVEEAAQELEAWNQRQDELRQTRERAQQRIAELRPQRVALLTELLLRNNRRAKDQLDRLTRDLRELEGIADDYAQVLAVASREGAELLAQVARHSATVRHLQAQLKARQLVRQAQAADEAAVAFLRELAGVRQCVEELVPLVPTAQQYLNQFRRGGGDLPIRLSLAYHCRALGMAGILDLPPYTPQSARPLAVHIGELLANLLKPTTDNSEVPSAELHGTDAPGSATTAQ